MVNRESERKRLVELLKKAPLCGRDFELQYSDHTIEKIADHLLDNGIVVSPCEVGDYVEWDNGIVKQLYQIRGFYYESSYGLRFELDGFTPIVSHHAITRIVPREEAEKSLKGVGRSER